MKLRHLWNNRRYLVRWLLIDTWQMWSAALPLGLTAWALHARSEFFLKLLGLSLQLAGVCVAALAVLSIMRLFNLEGWAKRVLRWWARRPFATRHVIAGSSFGGGYSTSARATQGLQNIDPQDDLSEQVAKLIKNQATMFKKAAALQTHVGELEHRLALSIRSEQDARTEAVEDVRKLMKQATVGSPMVALLGLYWIALGLVMATVPRELLCWCVNP